MDPQLITTTVVQVATITNGPAINNQQFQGWFQNPKLSNSALGNLEAINCPDSQSLFTTSNYAQCCNIGATTCTTMWTTCAGSNPVGVRTDTCGSGSHCQTVSIFDQLPTNNVPVYSQIICGPSNWAASSIYRTVISTRSSTALSTITASASASSRQALSGTATSTPTSGGTSNTSPPQSGSTSPSNTGSSPSKAWIAGAVIGPLVALAIIGLLVWLLFRKRKREHNNNTGPPPMEYTDNQAGHGKPWAPGSDTYAYGGYNNNPHEVHEIHSNYPNETPHELPGSEQPKRT